jgi:Flp pilus assembly secretin CpaC
VIGRRVFAIALALGLAGSSAGPALAAGDERARLQITTDRSQVVVLPDEPFTKLAVANPNVADVVVITPTQFLLNGKAAGVTSLIVFYPSRIRAFDVVVTPPPIGSAATPVVSEPHGVVIHRADKLSEQLFARDQDRQWVELGTIKAETDVGKK